MSRFPAQYGQWRPEARARGRALDARLAHQLAKNTVAHEMKLLADGKSRADVYGQLLPGYLAAKTGLSPAQCAEYCQARHQADAGESEGVELLARLLTRV